jgi:hypothetical protein
MTKSELLAKCLVDSKRVQGIDYAQFRVRRTFQENFPREDFSEWDSEIDDPKAEQIALVISQARSIKLKRIIELLW